ncbi:MAG: cyclic nucleotide-binding domain-containing protein [Lachnospiraceae bacterium]|nr:cyclic nucleotide-binding domain-containing protein [Lachnospiraceae bacterium]
MDDAKMILFPEGKVILSEGQINRDMYKIIKGHAEVYVRYGTEQETLISIIGPQSCFGELGMLLSKPEIYTVVAYSDVLALRITEENIGEFIQKNHRNVVDMMKNMANTIMTMKLQVELLLKELENGKKPDESTLLRTRKAIQGYGMYRSILEASDKIGMINKKT